MEKEEESEEQRDL